jgi:uncharacterized membrane protein (UPF0182 family)
MKSRLKWRLILVSLAMVGIAALLVGVSIVFLDYLVNFWWFDSLGYGFYYLLRLFYRYLIFALITLLFFLIFFLNFRIALRYLGSASPSAASKKYQGYEKLVRVFRRGSPWLYNPLALVLAVLVALPLFRQWQGFLFYVFGPDAGITDPVYGKDISFYLFSYPIYTLIQRRLLFAFLVLLLGLALIYWLEHRLLSSIGRKLPRGAKWHLSLLILLVFFIEIWDFLLQRYSLLYGSSHQPLFFGPGFVEMHIILPLIWGTLILLGATAFSLVYVIHAKKSWRRGLKVTLVFGVLFVLSLAGRHSSFLPKIVEKYLVKPSEISREKPFIESSIRATLQGYKLEEVEIRKFNPDRLPRDIDAPNVRQVLRNIPLWDRGVLADVYRDLQELRNYYVFPKINVGRYPIGERKQQVFLGARELDYTQLPGGAKNWINQHLAYTHGYGAVMTPASQGADEPIAWFLKGIPPQSEYGFTVKEPGIYYGLGSYTYAIAPNSAGEMDYPKGNDNAMTNYRGKGGVSVSSYWRKLLFGLYFQEKDIFFTNKIKEDSKILFRRNVRQRIRSLTPFFSLDRAPYLVVTSKGLYWVQDGYTTSSWFPNATPRTTDKERINYMRNSVKIVVDAYNGSVDFYIADPEDPIVRAYDRMYPGLLKELSRMDKDILRHIRYPQDFFETQMAVYAKYHMTDPSVYYEQEDVWEFSSARGDKRVGTEVSYFATLDLIEPGRLDFLLLLPMNPRNRDNLRALAVGGCDQPYYGKIILYEFPKGELVYGLPQIYALINEEPKIAKAFTLWDQAGSQLVQGIMLILPVGNTILYIQPIYLQASGKIKIPELQRIIMSQGQIVVMEKSLEEGYAGLNKLMAKEETAVESRFPPLSPASEKMGNGGSSGVSSGEKSPGDETKKKN